MSTIEQQVQAYVSDQRTFFLSKQTQPYEFRLKQINKLEASIRKYEPEIMAALQKDLNKNEFEAYLTEVSLVYNSISEIKKSLAQWMKPVKAKTPIYFQPAKSYIVREPYGVTCIIGPFNYPFQLVIEPLLGAIIGGNTAIIKPSETAVATGEVINKIIKDAFEPSYVRVVEGAKEMVTALIHAPFDYIFFTGSIQVGKIIAKACAERLTPHTLELGGKSPAIVDQTANLDVAAKRIAFGKFSNAGQTCVAPDYVLVHRSVHKQFIDQLNNTLKQFYGKNPKLSKDYGRIITTASTERLADILQQEQENIITGGEVEIGSRYVAPTVLNNITWDHPSMQDELFGPILPILVYDNLQNVISDIKQLTKPLAAYFFSENNKAIDYFTENLSFGGGCINDTILHVGNTNLPFGGVGASGNGSYHGHASFKAFTHEKSMLKRSTKINPSILFPPYSKSKVKIIKRIM